MACADQQITVPNASEEAYWTVQELDELDVSKADVVDFLCEHAPAWFVLKHKLAIVGARKNFLKRWTRLQLVSVYEEWHSIFGRLFLPSDALIMVTQHLGATALGNLERTCKAFRVHIVEQGVRWRIMHIHRQKRVPRLQPADRKKSIEKETWAGLLDSIERTKAPPLWTKWLRDPVNALSVLALAFSSDTSRVWEALRKGADPNAVHEGNRSATYCAAYNGAQGVIKALHSMGADVNKCNVNGSSPIYAAAFEGHTATIELLYSLGGDVLRADTKGHSAIYGAAQNGHTDTVALLHKLGCDVNKAADSGRTPLYAASQNGHTDTAEFLISVGADVTKAANDGRHPLWGAAFNGHSSTVRRLKELGAVVNQRDKDGFTPLYVASQKGHTDTVKLLHSLGGGINEPNTIDGATPIYIAAQFGFCDTVECLHKMGADVNRTKEGGNTPLYAAAHFGQPAVVKLLHQLGANVQVARKDGRSPIWTASFNGHTECVQILHEFGADVNCADDAGFSPLYAAAQKGHSDTVDCLFSYGADVNQPNSIDNASPLYIASQFGHTDTVRKLVALGADINHTKNGGNNAMYAASHFNKVETVQVLYDLGADVFRQADIGGRTPLQTAREQGNSDVADLLLKLQKDDEEECAIADIEITTDGSWMDKRNIARANSAKVRSAFLMIVHPSCALGISWLPTDIVQSIMEYIPPLIDPAGRFKQKKPEEDLNELGQVCCLQDDEECTAGAMPDEVSSECMVTS